MIVNAIQGNLIELFKSGEYDAIAHGCNCFCRMGSGVAVDVREAFPDAYYKVDCMTKDGDRTKMGTFSHLDTEFGVVFNAYTQYTYWNPADMFSIEALKAVMGRINDHLKQKGKNKLLIPCIGAGLARGDWNDIVKVIDDYTPEIEVTVVIWELERDTKLLNWYGNFALN